MTRSAGAVAAVSAGGPAVTLGGSVVTLWFSAGGGLAAGLSGRGVGARLSNAPLTLSGAGSGVLASASPEVPGLVYQE